MVTLLNRLGSSGDRDWYAEKAVANGWSGKVLEHHIATDLRRRIAAAPSNFDTHLTGADSDLAKEIVRDPYVFDFLNLTTRASERDVEQAMMDRLQETLLELGSGFAFVGRQVRLEVDGDEFFIDCSDSRVIPRLGQRVTARTCGFGRGRSGRVGCRNSAAAVI